jgi:hypothetical protein
VQSAVISQKGLARSAEQSAELNNTAESFATRLASSVLGGRRTWDFQTVVVDTPPEESATSQPIREIRE